MSFVSRADPKALLQSGEWKWEALAVKYFYKCKIPTGVHLKLSDLGISWHLSELERAL